MRQDQGDDMSDTVLITARCCLDVILEQLFVMIPAVHSLINLDLVRCQRTTLLSLTVMVTRP
jgi:hypothetical protein